MNASIWATVSHLREEESLMQGRWAEHMRQTDPGVPAGKRRKSVDQKVILIIFTSITIAHHF